MNDVTYRLIHGDCLTELPKLAAQSVDTIITDPPYGLGFMGKAWDHGVPGVPFWEAAYRVAKPGAMLLAFGGTRTFHRLACAIEDAGWEIRDTVMWVYGSGFPKSLDVSKAIDKAARVEREVVGMSLGKAGENLNRLSRPNGEDVEEARGCGAYGTGAKQVTVRIPITTPATNAAKQWQGWGTALKPAWEPIIIAMKPVDGTFVNNALEYGVAGLNIDGCRIPTNPDVDDMLRVVDRKEREAELWKDGSGFKNENNNLTGVPLNGRWPANFIHDGSDEVVGLFPDSDGQQGNIRGTEPSHTGGEDANCYGEYGRVAFGKRDDSGSAARFFYCAKASKAERGEGNTHPTVKPLELMRYLVRLTKTPAGGVVLDPFIGSGSTSVAAILEERPFIGIDLEDGYIQIAERRIKEAVVEVKNRNGQFVRTKEEKSVGQLSLFD